MAIDYKITDLKTSFSVSEASFAWCDADRPTPDNINNLYMMEAALIEAIKEEEIKAEVPRMVVERRIRGSRYDMEEPDYERAIIPRKELIRWAEARGQKPKFLFPEMRVAVAEKCEAVPQENPPPKPLPQRENRMHGLLERVCLDLFAQYKRWPQAKEVLQALEQEENNPDRSSKYDPDGIIQEIKGTTIYWQSDGADEPKMELKTLQNRIGILKENHKTQKAKRKIPA